jgi:hypothetical protein
MGEINNRKPSSNAAAVPTLAKKPSLQSFKHSKDMHQAQNLPHSSSKQLLIGINAKSTRAVLKK